MVIGFPAVLIGCKVAALRCRNDTDTRSEGCLVNDGQSPDQDRGRQARLSLASFDVFYRRYLPVLVRYLISQASDSRWAQDIAQDAMIAACDRWDDLLTFDRPDSWLFEVATRKLRRLEARARERCWLGEEPGSVGDLRATAAGDAWVSDHLDLIAALRALPRRQAEVIGLHFLCDYTITDTAVILGIGEGTARTHLDAGMENLRKHQAGRTGSAGTGRRP